MTDLLSKATPYSSLELRMKRKNDNINYGHIQRSMMAYNKMNFQCQKIRAKGRGKLHDS